MSLFKRISATVSASVDQAVSRVENHDAIIEASIKETRQAAARTRVHLTRVQRDGENLQQKREKTKQDITLWTDRAMSVAESDQEKALQCLKQKKHCETTLDNLQQSFRKYEEVEKNVRENLTKIESRITDMSQQRNAMRSRQSAAEAMRVISHLEGGAQSEIEDTFDRWEISLAETEITVEQASTTNVLEYEFLQQEEKDSLKMELEALLHNKEQ